jgi:hypothetical protein
MATKRELAWQNEILLIDLSAARRKTDECRQEMNSWQRAAKSLAKKVLKKDGHIPRSLEREAKRILKR